MNTQSPHSFHIPVMGLAFTVDTPVKVARYGISSVVSILEDALIEKMRNYYYKSINEEYKPITNKEHDFRAKRITDYLNLLQRIVNMQLSKLKKEAFTPDSDLSKYFEMLPDSSKDRLLYYRMLAMPDSSEKTDIQNILRNNVVAGSIDANIMTKVDFNISSNNNASLEKSSVALSALRGYANSSLTNSSIVFSAGLNPRLYDYILSFNDFIIPTDSGFAKRIIIKVSDYRSALVQGRYLARKGIWVSEFRIESSLNCGGHAFVTDGYLLGPILNEFASKRIEMLNELRKEYIEACNRLEIKVVENHLYQKITVQGGIGTHAEDKFLFDKYGIDGTGWGTPFLLVPEATTVDNHTIELLSKAKAIDLSCEKYSPLGIKFNYLSGTTAEKERLNRIEQLKPGSQCTERFLATNTEFTEQPICNASHLYQSKKLAQLQSLSLSDKDFQEECENLFNKECLCINLSNAALLKYKLDPIQGNSLAVTVCPGPNIAYFSKIATLKEMADHIYGRKELPLEPERPHFFIQELKLYLKYLLELVDKFLHNSEDKLKIQIKKFCDNLFDGIEYYKNLIADNMFLNHFSNKLFFQELNNASTNIHTVLQKLNPITI